MSTNKIQQGDSQSTVGLAPPYSAQQVLANPSLTEQYLQLANEFHTGRLAPIDPMPRPPPLEGAPMGLEYLVGLDEITVNQKTNMQERLTTVTMPSRYTVVNSQGQLIYMVTEQSGGLQRQCCGSNRGFVLHINDNSGQEVIRVRRQFMCSRSIPCIECCCCCSQGGCSAMELEVEAPIGQIRGYVQERCKCGSARLAVLDAEGQDVFTIDGPRGCCGAVNNYAMKDGRYTICTSDEDQQVGTITKHYMGVGLAALTTKDKFVASFPMDLDVKMKAVLLGAVFMIDFMYFEYAR